jgi:hypothetical protein
MVVMGASAWEIVLEPQILMKLLRVSMPSPVCLQNSEIVNLGTKWETLPAVHYNPQYVREASAAYENAVFRLEKPFETRYRDKGRAVNFAARWISDRFLSPRQRETVP